jgi:hypothetical protein
LLTLAARRALRDMDPAKYEFQSEFAKRYVAQGEALGEAKGRAALIAKQLALRFGPLPEDVKTRLDASSIVELDAIGERLMSAKNLSEALTER